MTKGFAFITILLVTFALIIVASSAFYIGRYGFPPLGTISTMSQPTPTIYQEQTNIVSTKTAEPLFSGKVTLSDIDYKLFKITGVV